jgi:HEAT repeat protein
VRAKCLEALGASTFWTDREIFKKALNDPARQCRWEALTALRHKKDASVVPDVIEALRTSEDLEIRLAAINLLSELAAKEAIPVLIEIVTDLLERNRSGQAACRALTRITGQTISAENYIAWEKWYKAYCESAAGASQGSPSGVGSSPAEGKGAEGAAPPENK